MRVSPQPHGVGTYGQDLEMEVRSTGRTGGSRVTDELSLDDVLSLVDDRAAQMSVPGVNVAVDL